MGSPSLVFIHGRHAKSGDWVAAINEGLRTAQRSPLPEDLNIVEVNYADVLHDVLAGMPDQQIEPATTSEAFARRQRMIRLSMHPFTERPRSPYDFAPKEWVTRMIMTRMPEIQRYRANPALRAAVRDSCLAQLPDGEVILVAHSLGSVVAYDLLHYLPNTTHIEALLTIGSPMARRSWRTTLDPYRGHFPTGSVTTWVTLVNVGDWVTGGDGIHLWYPQAIDTYASLGLGNHAEVHYLACKPAGVVIGDAISRAAAGAHR